MASQWFGDLVTTEYWGELFLNEGFASYLEFVGAEAAQPAFSYLDRFYVDDTIVGLAADAKNSTHPLASFSGGSASMLAPGTVDPMACRSKCFVQLYQRHSCETLAEQTTGR